MANAMSEPRTPSSTRSLCVVTPCFNEQEVIGRFHEELVRALEGIEGLEFRILYVDDGSRDATLQRLNELGQSDDRVLVASLSRNFGHQVALTAGLGLARGDAVVVMDSDLQHPPALIPRLVEEWRAGHDIVSAVRERTEDASWLKNVSSRLFYWFINRLGDTDIVPGAADFYLLSRRAHAALASMPERHRFLRGMVSWMGFTRAFVPFDAPARAAGSSKYDAARMFGMGWDAVLSFSVAPIRLMSRLGIGVTLAGFAYLVYVLARAALLGDLVQGWGSLISVVLILGGLQFLFMGLMGEYLARVFEEVKHRPLYLLKQELPRGAWAAGFTRGDEDP